MASSLIKEEKEIHRQAFEFYYLLGKKRNLRDVAKEFNKSLTSVHNWSQSFDWKNRIEIREIETARMLENETNETVVEIKARYQTILKALIEQAMKDFREEKFKIETPLDLIRVMQMSLELIGEGNTGSAGLMNELTEAISSGRKLYEEQLRAQGKASDEEG